jgi:hypothetical protein
MHVLTLLPGHLSQLGQLDQDRVRQLYGDALRDFLTNKRTSFHLSFFIETFRRYPMLGALVAPAAVDAFKEASKPFAHIQAFALLEALVKLPVGDATRAFRG